MTVAIPIEPTQAVDRFAAEALTMLPDFAIMARLRHETGELIACAVNPAAERLLGLPRHQILGKPLRSLLADESPFQSKQQRESFNAELRRRGVLEFPGLAQVRDAEGKRLNLRVRICWPEGGDQVLVLGEDVTHRNALSEHSAAIERLRSAVQVSLLLSHHVNNALTAAEFNVELARTTLPAMDASSREAHAFLSQASEAITTASRVVVGMVAAAGVDPTATDICDLKRAIRSAVATSLQDVELRGDACSTAPCHVWGALNQVELVLGGILGLLSAGRGVRLCTTISRDDQRITLRIDADAPGEHYLRALLDPTVPQPPHDGAAAVRLFSSSQVLHAIGGTLGLPHATGDGLSIELTFRPAPELAPTRQPMPAVLLVSGDGALRAVASGLLSDYAMHYSQSIREGIAWLMRPQRGVVICDIDELGLSAPELVAFQRIATGGDTKRLILASRRHPPDPSIPLPQLQIPFDTTTLRSILEASI